jgi:hypothetical protein
MAKKKTPAADENKRQSRKEILIAERQASQTRTIRLAILGIVLLLAIVIVAGVVNVVFIKPNAPVANIAGSELSMGDWRQRVKLQRAQLILGIEDLAESLGQDIGQVQQFAGQQLLLLTQDSERLGQIVLDQMIDEALIQQAAESRGIIVSDDDVQKEIEESFNYLGGASPTALPTPTETVIPTPSLTPIPTAVITELLPTRTPFPTPTLGPTRTPLPTPTPLTENSFGELYEETIDRFQDFGIKEEQFRNIVKSQIYQERFLEELVREEELSDEAMHASFFYLMFGSEAEAQQSLDDIDRDGFLHVWNTIASKPFDPEDQDSAFASELLWRTEDNIALLLDEAASLEVFSMPLDSRSKVIIVPAATEEEDDSFYIIFVTGREIRTLSESAISNARQELLNGWLQGLRASEVDTFERWRTNVPQQPSIDPRFLVPPTPTPFIPIEVTPGAPEDSGE